jgi:hypothetical protein
MIHVQVNIDLSKKSKTRQKPWLKRYTNEQEIIDMFTHSLYEVDLTAK